MRPFFILLGREPYYMSTYEISQLSKDTAICGELMSVLVVEGWDRD